MRILRSAFVTALLLLLLPITLDCANTYNVGDRVPLFVNKIGPLHNPSETYEYYELPFCRPDQVIQKKESFGEVLGGDRLANALYDLRFAVNTTRSVVCPNKLTKGDVTKFRDAITNDFYYNMYYDDLPLWAYIGKVEDESWKTDNKAKIFLLFTHVHFDAFYNGNQVIEIHAFSEPSHMVDVTEDVDVEVEFTYSISWKRTSMPYENRMERYARASSLHIIHQSHWFSLANSIVIVILLTGLLTLLMLRHVKNDLRKWSIGDEDEEKEVGWKHIHEDVFRCPTNLPLFSALLGCGTQLLTMFCILFILSYLGVFQPYSRGSLSSYVFISYILTSAIAGYRSASFCSQYAETGRGKSLLFAGTLFLGPLLITSFILNLLAASFGVTAALPLGTICIIVLVYILVSVPLLALGGVFGHRYKSASPASPITKKFPREIPSLPWYRKTPAQMFLAGLLPFSAVALELHHFYATIWGYKLYSSPGILFLTFVVLILITAILSVGLTYFQLAVEDHEWQWRSVMRGGSTAIFMFCYCIYFYLHSNMTGLLQTAFFFGYNACICYTFFLVLGAVSFQASLLFVRRIYHAIKSE
ncbi:transmembrane 9 superfamily member 5-like isoform X2 [Salvia divinorum]|uniref:Transmembrane 9 superfamily member n=1 Tax=Salvia divinorum TaxID=28513 RepID=A0ABD1HNK3_SALDI